MRNSCLLALLVLFTSSARAQEGAGSVDEAAPTLEAAPVDAPDEARAPPADEESAPPADEESAQPPAEPSAEAPDEAAAEAPPPEEAPLSLRRDVLPWVTAFAGGTSAILGAGLLAVGFYPFLQVVRLEGELAAAKARPPLEGDDVILLPMLEASAYDRRQAFQTWGSPLAAGGAALLIGGALMVAGGVFVGVSRKLEVLE